MKLGFINFGGPTGQIAIMHHELVDQRGWIDEGRFLHALNFCMLLPGPEAIQLAIYVGWLLNGTLGGLAAGVFFLLPAVCLLFGLSWLYAAHGDVVWVAAIFHGLAAAVVGIVAAALIRIGRRALRNAVMAGIAIAAFVAIFAISVPFPAIVLSAGLLGLVGRSAWPRVFSAGENADGGDPAIGRSLVAPAAGGAAWSRAARVLAVGLAVWWGPLLLVALARGSDDVLTREALFFSKVAAVSFGGAYAALAYVNQAAQHFGWLTAGEMASGLSLAETTPGPLILVVQFVGFVAAYRSPGGLAPVVAGTIGGLVTVWATFVPSFLWIFLGAPFLEPLRTNRRLTAALTAITAAIVGVIANLAASFGISTMFERVGSSRFLGHSIPAPVLGSIDLFAVAVAGAAFIGIWRFRWSVVWVVLASGIAGWLWSLVR